MRKFTAAGQAVTAVPTAFLASDMLDAPSDYVKVYLYGLYLAQAAEAASDVSMENKLHMKSSEIDQALRYWTDRGLVSCIRTEEGTLYSFGPAQQPERRELYPYSAFNLRARETLERDLSAMELQRLYSYIEEDHLPQEVVLRLLEYCVGVAGKSVNIKYIDKVEAAWTADGICTLEAAEEAIEDYKSRTSGARKIQRKMGIRSGVPGETELAFYEKWTKEWGFEHEAIVAAMKGKEFSKNAPFKYLDAILQHYKEHHLTTAREVTEQAEKLEKRNNRIKDILRALGRKSLEIKVDYINYYNSWQQAGYKQAVVLLAARQAAAGGSQNGFERTDRILKTWQEHDLRTEEQVRAHLERRHALEKRVREVLDAANIEARVQDKDLTFYANYVSKQGMQHDTMLKAARMSASSDSPGRFLRGLVRQWANAGVHTPEQAEQFEARRTQPRLNVRTPASERPALSADQRGQRAIQGMKEKYGQ